jgi:hypothetical protein
MLFLDELLQMTYTQVSKIIKHYFIFFVKKIFVKKK